VREAAVKPSDIVSACNGLNGQVGSLRLIACVQFHSEPLPSFQTMTFGIPEIIAQPQSKLFPHHVDDELPEKPSLNRINSTVSSKPGKLVVTLVKRQQTACMGSD
jgi:hypothetical protein